jgi:CspA family cold shock protein
VRVPQLAGFDGGFVAMATGKVKWFNNAKGYGFILAHTGGDDLFVHYSSIQMDGYKTLKAGQPVEFDIQQGPKGLHAVNIRIDEAALAEDNEILRESATEAGPPVAVDATRAQHDEVIATGR